jgi:Cdc6-like AAA superfamily ATPase
LALDDFKARKNIGICRTIAEMKTWRGTAQRGRTLQFARQC